LGEGLWELRSSRPFDGPVMIEGVYGDSRCGLSATKNWAPCITDVSVPVTLQPAQLV